MREAAGGCGGDGNVDPYPYGPASPTRPQPPPRDGAPHVALFLEGIVGTALSSSEVQALQYSVAPNGLKYSIVTGGLDLTPRAQPLEL